MWITGSETPSSSCFLQNCPPPIISSPKHLSLIFLFFFSSTLQPHVFPRVTTVLTWGKSIKFSLFHLFIVTWNLYTEISIHYTAKHIFYIEKPIQYICKLNHIALSHSYALSLPCYLSLPVLTAFLSSLQISAVPKTLKTYRKYPPSCFIKPLSAGGNSLISLL